MIDRRHFAVVLAGATALALAPTPLKKYFFAPAGGWMRSQRWNVYHRAYNWQIVFPADTKLIPGQSFIPSAGFALSASGYGEPPPKISLPGGITITEDRFDPGPGKVFTAAMGFDGDLYLETADIPEEWAPDRTLPNLLRWNTRRVPWVIPTESH